MNEITLRELEISYKLPTVTFDIEPLQAQINQIKKQYDGWVLKDDDVATAKKISAQINKVAKQISDKRIAIAKQIKEPITKFENDIKTLTKELETLSGKIKSQIDEFDTKQKESKRAEIKELPEWTDYMIFDESWLNKTFAIADVQKNLSAQKTNFQNNSLLIQTSCKGYGLEPEKYLEKLAHGVEINEIIKILTNDYEVKQKYATTEPIATAPIITIEDVADTKTYEYRLLITGTKAQLKALRQYIDDNGLKYEKI